MHALQDEDVNSSTELEIPPDLKVSTFKDGPIVKAILRLRCTNVRVHERVHTMKPCVSAAVGPADLWWAQLSSRHDSALHA